MQIIKICLQLSQIILKHDKEKNDKMYHNNICNFNVYDIMMYLCYVCYLCSINYYFH